MDIRVFFKSILILLLIENTLQKNKIIRYSNLKTRTNPLIANITEATLGNGTKNLKGYFTHLDPLTIFLFKEFQAIYIGIQLTNMKSDQNLVSLTINMCNMKEECKRGNIFAKSICNTFDKSAKFKIVCPFKEGPYEFNEFVFPQAELPNFFPINDKFQITITSKGKRNNKLLIIAQTALDLELKEVD